MSNTEKYKQLTADVFAWFARALATFEHLGNSDAAWDVVVKRMGEISDKYDGNHDLAVSPIILGYMTAIERIVKGGDKNA